MAYVVAAIWRAKEGKEETIAQALQKMAPLSRQEPGCLLYVVHRSPTNPRTFFLYEQYNDENGYQAHLKTSHFEQYGRLEGIPNLESREREFYETLDY
jgi:quinol monooxygenase YgiN